MSIIRPWAIWRRLQYALGFFLFWGMVLGGIYYLNFYTPPSCLDLIKNGDEKGIDCGGSCVQFCPADVLPPRVIWAESFEINEGQYNAVAYIENPNHTIGTPEMGYTFELFNNGEVIATESGKTILPPGGSYAIFKGKIFTKDKLEVTKTEVTLQPAELWLPASVGRDQFKIVEFTLTGADDRPELVALLENTELVEAEDVEIVAVIFNEDSEPVTVSQTYVDRIEERSTQDIVFTWPNPIAHTVRSCIIPTDVALAIDLSGSMNNDGANPPQPVTDALRAAGQFIEELEDGDQISVATFATQAAVSTRLTSAHEAAANSVRALNIDPSEESGFTNTVAALQVAQLELDSVRHNNDARRVLVLLTDGLPTAPGDEDVVGAAEKLASQLDSRGIEIYAIGLGQSVDRQFIKNIASDDTNAFFAPTSEDLNSIYSRITSDLCEVGPTKIDIIAKTEANFEEIR